MLPSIWTRWLSFQLSVLKIKEPFAWRSSRTGSSNTPLRLNLVSDGPSPRTTTFLEALPVMIKPPITTLSPVSTRARVDMFRASVGGGVAVGVAVGVPVAVAVGVAVAVAVGVGVGGWVGTTMPAENSEVFPTASVAVAVTMRPLATVTLRDTLKETL